MKVGRSGMAEAGTALGLETPETSVQIRLPGALQ